MTDRREHDPTGHDPTGHDSSGHEHSDLEYSDHRRSAVADRIVVSYPGDLSSWGRFQVEKPAFRAFLRKTRDRATEGETWEEFVGVGCCGNTLDVPLRVERVEAIDDRGEDNRGANDRGADDRGADDRGADDRGADDRGADDRGADDREAGAEIGPDTEIEYTVRESCGLQGSWRVQSAGGPAHSSTAVEKPR